MTAEELLLKRIEHDFTYHPPDAEQRIIYDQIRSIARVFAKKIATDIPVSREQSLAITKLEECVFWANAAIARHWKDEENGEV